MPVSALWFLAEIKRALCPNTRPAEPHLSCCLSALALPNAGAERPCLVPVVARAHPFPGAVVRILRHKAGLVIAYRGLPLLFFCHIRLHVEPQFCLLWRSVNCRHFNALDSTALPTLAQAKGGPRMRVNCELIRRERLTGRSPCHNITMPIRS